MRNSQISPGRVPSGGQRVYQVKQRGAVERPAAQGGISRRRQGICSHYDAPTPARLKSAFGVPVYQMAFFYNTIMAQSEFQFGGRATFNDFVVLN
ncbi:hypothetical protein [Pseudomonas oryzihabitans]|uniref:hypothetical protein n=1 Tax=Pseudomonas oryzihabitans TaxID=47885 RepID=UPI001ABF5BD5|nr:hypothetical protein [Pseudomonas oryzihabitans]